MIYDLLMISNLKPQISKLKSVIQTLNLLTIFLFLTFTLYASPVYADCVRDARGDCQPAGLAQIEDTFSNFISVFVGFAFVALLIVAMMAGFKYLTSGGEPKAVSAAHQTLSWALLGIFMMAVAWIVLLLIKEFTGVNVLNFNIKTLCNGIPGC